MDGFDIESLNLNDEPLEGLQEAYENWQPGEEFPPPMPPTKVSAVIAGIERASTNANNQLTSVTLNFTCKGGPYDGRTINYQRLWANVRERGGRLSSDIIDMVRSSGIEGVPRTSHDLIEMIDNLQKTGRCVNFKTNLEATCSDCAKEVLMKETETDTIEAAYEALTAIQQSDPERAKAIRKAEREARTPFKSARAIKVDPETKQFVSEVECPRCHKMLFVRPRIALWLAPSNGGGEEI